MVLVNSYSGIVISSLTVPKIKKSIESLEDLAASDKVGVVLRSDVSTGAQILVSITVIIIRHSLLTTTIDYGKLSVNYYTFSGLAHEKLE